MSEISLILVLHLKTNKIPNDMAKVRIKSEKLTPFGGIFAIMEQFSNVRKITYAEIAQSRAPDEVIPFRKFIVKNDMSALLRFVGFFNGSFRFIRSLIYCSDNG